MLYGTVQRAIWYIIGHSRDNLPSQSPGLYEQNQI